MLIFFGVLAGLMLLLAIGTHVPNIPVLSSFSNTITITGAHIYLVVQIVCLLFLFIGDWGITDTYLISIGVIFLCSILLQIGFIILLLFPSHALGLSVNFFKGYWPTRFHGVNKEVHTYGETYPDSQLNVYYKDDGKFDKPVVIYTHGGGWFYGSKEDRTYYHKDLVDKGYVVVSIGYQLSNKKTHGANDTEQQILEGIEWVIANIDRYHGRADEWYLTGDSAGGNLALNLGFKMNAGRYLQSTGQPFPHINAVSVTYPVADPAAFYHNTDLIMGWVSRYAAKSYTGGTPERHPEVYAAITPGNFISPQSPPVSIVMGDQDAAVPPKATITFVEALDEAGIPVQLIVLPHANHACDTFWGSIASETYMAATSAWFERYA